MRGALMPWLPAPRSGPRSRYGPRAAGLPAFRWMRCPRAGRSRRAGAQSAALHRVPVLTPRLRPAPSPAVPQRGTGPSGAIYLCSSATLAPDRVGASLSRRGPPTNPARPVRRRCAAGGAALPLRPPGSRILPPSLCVLGHLVRGRARGARQRRRLVCDPRPRSVRAPRPSLYFVHFCRDTLLLPRPSQVCNSVQPLAKDEDYGLPCSHSFSSVLLPGVLAIAAHTHVRAVAALIRPGRCLRPPTPPSLLPSTPCPGPPRSWRPWRGRSLLRWRQRTWATAAPRTQRPARPWAPVPSLCGRSPAWR